MLEFDQPSESRSVDAQFPRRVAALPSLRSAEFDASSNLAFTNASLKRCMNFCDFSLALEWIAPLIEISVAKGKDC